MFVELLQVIALSNPFYGVEVPTNYIRNLKKEPVWIQRLESKGSITAMSIEVGQRVNSLRINRSGVVSQLRIESDAKLNHMLRTLENSLNVTDGLFDQLSQYDTAIYPASFGTVTRTPDFRGGYVLTVTFKNEKNFNTSNMTAKG